MVAAPLSSLGRFGERRPQTTYSTILLTGNFLFIPIDNSTAQLVQPDSTDGLGGLCMLCGLKF